MQIEELLKIAAEKLIRNKKLPVSILDIQKAPSGEFKYYVYLRDDKIYKNEKLVSDGWFRVVFNDDIIRPGTCYPDIAGNIPSNIDSEKKIILRAAYVMNSHYQINILNVYKKIEPDAKKLTLANALAWYKELD